MCPGNRCLLLLVSLFLTIPGIWTLSSCLPSVLVTLIPPQENWECGGASSLSVPRVGAAPASGSELTVPTSLGRKSRWLQSWGGSAPGVSGHQKNIQKEERDRAPQDSVQGEADRMRASV